MTKSEIIQRVKELDLPEGEYIVFGSCPMAVAGIRESGDVDLLVSDQLLEQLKQNGWELLVKGPNDNPFVFDVFEAHSSWNFSSYKPTLEDLLATANTVEGVAFASLQEVRKWKEASARPKDLIDIKLIDAYLAKT